MAAAAVVSTAVVAADTGNRFFTEQSKAVASNGNRFALYPLFFHPVGSAASLLRQKNTP